MQGVNWLITDNSGKIGKWHGLSQSDQLKFMVYQLERGEETGRAHIQAFVSFNKKKKLSSVKKFIGDNPHCEIARKPAEAIEYCKKDETRVEGPWEVGQWSGQGQRKDLDVIKERLDRGESESTIADNHFGSWVRYRKSFVAYRQLKLARRDWEMDVKVFWGSTGTGKTRDAWQEAGPDAFLISTDKNYPFTGYAGQENIIWDEFTGSSCDIKYLLQLLDRYPMKVRGLYEEYNFVGRRIWLTSNIDPRNWYPNAHPEHVKALLRRLPNITHYNPPLGDEVTGTK